MSVIIFFIILAILVLVHEFGHFIVAKRSGIRVDEFGLGFPPRLWSYKVGETVYSINAIPFGGFVKIFGENPNEESISGPDNKRSFINKNRGIQAAVLSAGILFNIIFAWLLISFGFMSGLPVPADEYASLGSVSDVRLVITSILNDSPAAKAGLKTGDAILLLQAGKETLQDPTLSKAQNFIGSHGVEPLSILYRRGENTGTVNVIPKEGVLKGRFAIGISMDMIGTLSLPIPQALFEGGKTTGRLLETIAIGLGSFITGAATGHADLSSVTGPVGIAGMVGDVRALGFVYLISFTAFISLNLAVINLLPFPALDGGRLLFVLIETVKRSRINPKFSNALNTVGFVILMLLMVVVTFRDVVKLF